MPLNEKGVHIYTETDEEATASELLNLGQESISAALKYFADTGAKRTALSPAPAGALWQDTDGDRLLWSEGPGGEWRKHSGVIPVAAGAWQSSTAPAYGRTVALTVDTVLRAEESLEVFQLENSGTGFTSVSLASVTRNPTNTSIGIRHMQMIAATTQPIRVGWRIISVGL